MNRLTDHLRPGIIYFQNRAFDPPEILDGIDVIAKYLKDNLVSSSPFIYLFASNHIKTVLAFFGIIKSGHIVVVVDPATGPLELSEMTDQTPPAALIKADVSTLLWDFPSEIEIRPCAMVNDTDGTLTDVCMLMYTAAEDGFAKAAMLTHENLSEDAFAGAVADGVGGDSVCCSILPLSHAFGLQTGILTPLLNGGSACLLEEKELSSPLLILEKLSQYGVTHLYSVPVTYYLLGKVTGGLSRLVKLRSITSGGYALPPFLKEKWYSQHSIVIRQGYGLTEASPVCTWSYPETPYALNTIGKPLGCCEVKIFSVTGITDIPMTEGEIVVRGKNVMMGYYGKKECSNEKLRDGWLFTGDIGYQDNDGYFYFKTTKKRMINHAGIKLYPAEIERLLLQNKCIQKVSIEKVEDRLIGEKAIARVFADRSAGSSFQEIESWIHANISSFKLPQKISFADVDDSEN